MSVFRFVKLNNMAITYKHTSLGGGIVYRLDIQKAMQDKQVNGIYSVWIGNLDDDSTIIYIDEINLTNGILEIRLPWKDLPSYDAALGFEFNEDEGYIENTSFYIFDIDASKIGSSGWFYLSNLV